jgi:hypothetical protein
VAKFVEDKANGPAVMNALQPPGHGPHPHRAEGSKYARASAVSPLTESGNVVLPAPSCCPTSRSWSRKRRTSRTAAHDDTIDAMSQAINRLLLMPLTAGLGDPSTLTSTSRTTSAATRSHLTERGNMPGIMESLGLRKPQPQEKMTEAWRLEDAAYRLDTATENLARLQLMYEDGGWESLTAVGRTEFTRDGLSRNAELCRVMFVANPLMKRGLGIRASYVFGQGVQINARDEDVDAVVQAYLDDEGNRDAVTGAQARTILENELGTDGNVFLAHFTNPLIGRVKVRPLPFDEIVEIITEPGDKTTHWFYRRRWVETTLTSTFGSLDREREALYPALKYQPLTKPKQFAGVDVMWDAPVLHVKVNPTGPSSGVSVTGSRRCRGAGPTRSSSRTGPPCAGHCPGSRSAPPPRRRRPRRCSVPGCSSSTTRRWLLGVPR